VRISTLLAALCAVGVVAAGCGSDDDSDTGTAASTPAAAATTSASTTAAAADSATDLKSVCPSTVTIQTDWYPEADHSEAYAIAGPDGDYDASKKAYTAPLMAQGKDTGVKVEVRAGGPAIGFEQVSAQMYTDPDILLGYVNTDESVQLSGKQATIAVMAPRAKWAQVLIYAPEVYNFKSIADIGKTDTKVLYFQGNVYMNYLIGAGILKKSQTDSSYDGSPARFVASQGKVVQQGFITAEPWQYQHTVKPWMKPVKTLSIADTGYPNYGEALAVTPANKAKYGDCLKKLIPIIQQAQVDYAKDPTAANAIIVKAAALYKGWDYPAALAAYAAKAQVDQGIIANGYDGTMGSEDPANVQKIIDITKPIYEKQNIKVKDPLAPADISTNEYLDKSIHM
jgi:hypothetical protein